MSCIVSALVGSVFSDESDDRGLIPSLGVSLCFDPCLSISTLWDYGTILTTSHWISDTTRVKQDGLKVCCRFAVSCLWLPTIVLNSG